ncbi:MAG TPA: hypothetical protein VIL48_18410 [Acidimicrobiales bacterium]
MAELDDRPGPARDHLAASQRAWHDDLEREATQAGADDGRQFAFELSGIAMAYSTASRLLGDRDAKDKARAAYAALVDRLDRSAA